MHAVVANLTITNPGAPEQASAGVPDGVELDGIREVVAHA